jgi:hypothetical protein
VGDLAAELVAAVASDPTPPAAELERRALELAGAVLSSPAVSLASRIAEGGPLLLTRALQLAELVASATPTTRRKHLPR